MAKTGILPGECAKCGGCMMIGRKGPECENCGNTTTKGK